MSPSRTVSYYREDDRLAVTVKSGRLKFFTPTMASARRLRRVLLSLSREARLAFDFAAIYGGGIHCFIDPVWLTLDKEGR